MKKNSESKKQPYRIYLPVNLADRRMSKKKQQHFFLLDLRYCHFEQDGWKNKTFFVKDKLNMNLQSNFKKICTSNRMFSSAVNDRFDE